MSENSRRSKLPALILHGGAGSPLGSPEVAKRVRESLQRIGEKAFAKLRTGKALSCAVWAVRELENDPQFNAGTGAKLQIDGAARLTAALMDGRTRRFSGVLNLEEVKNPIDVAVLLQLERDRVLGGEGAKRYARQKGFGLYNPITERMWLEWKGKISRGRVPSEGSAYGTVGCVAVDRFGHCAAATSTGGKGMELVGRISDTGTVAGNFASPKAAVSATGVGEEIVDFAIAARIVTRVDDGMTLKEAFGRTFREFKRYKGRGGAIGVDARGNVMVFTTTVSILHYIRTPSVRRGYP